MRNIIIFGVSKIADIVYAYMSSDANYNIVAFTVDREYIKENSKFGLPVVAYEDIEAAYPCADNDMIVAIGYHKMNSIRAQKCKEAIEKGYDLVSYIHPNADISQHASIGNNCIILNNVSVEPFVKIGNNVCIYCNSTIAHHSKIGDNVWVTSGTVVGGNSEIGDNTFLGINSTIGHNIKIGAENFIGANAIVTKNSEDKSVYIVQDTPKYRLDVTSFMKLFKFD